jgi:hypothetical protein
VRFENVVRIPGNATGRKELPTSGKELPMESLELKVYGNANIFKEWELAEDSVVKESLITAGDGERYQTKLFNLDTIISVGYRFISFLKEPPAKQSLGTRVLVHIRTRGSKE